MRCVFMQKFVDAGVCFAAQIDMSPLDFSLGRFLIEDFAKMYGNLIKSIFGMVE